MQFKQYIEESEWLEFQAAINEAINVIESNQPLTEGVLSSFSKRAKDGVQFVKEFAELVGGNLLDILKLFKNRVVFKFFSRIKWSVSELLRIVKKGYKLWGELHGVIAEYIANSKIVKFTDAHLKDLDLYLQEHPVLKRAGALVVAGFLIYQWTQMISFTGDIDFDFDQSVLFAAISGNFSLSDLFSGPDGVRMLMFIATGVLTGATFPWPGNAWLLFAVSIVYTVSKDKYPAIAKSIIKNVKKFNKVTKVPKELRG